MNAAFSKTEKARRLFELGFTRRQVADLIMNGNIGFAYNVWKKWNEEQRQGITALPFEKRTDDQRDEQRLLRQ